MCFWVMCFIEFMIFEKNIIIIFVLIVIWGGNLNIISISGVISVLFLILNKFVNILIKNVVIKVNNGGIL